MLTTFVCPHIKSDDLCSANAFVPSDIHEKVENVNKINQAISESITQSNKYIAHDASSNVNSLRSC